MCTWSRPHAVILSLLILLFVTSGCDLNNLAQTQPERAEGQSGEYGWFYIDELVGTTCEQLRVCGLVDNFNACTAAVLSSRILPETLGADPSEFPRAYELREGERMGGLQANEVALESCLLAVEETDCESLNPSALDDPELGAVEILKVVPSCNSIYY